MTAHKVLVPLDGSRFSRQIVPHVLRFLDPQEDELILLRVAPLPAGLPVPPPQPLIVGALMRPAYQSEHEIERARHPMYWDQELASRGAALEDELQADAGALRAAGYSVTTVVRFGDPAEEIVNIVGDEAVDLVAMATHGWTGLSRIVLGSVADQVLRRVSIPVLLVRPFGWPAATYTSGEVLAKHLAEGQPVRTAVATDGLHLTQMVSALAGGFGRALKAEVALLVAIQGSQEEPLTPSELKSARNLLVEAAPGRELTACVGCNYEVVLEHLAKTPFDLLVVVPFEDRSSAHPFALGLTAQRLVQLAPTSVLVVKGEAPAFGRILACTEGDDGVVMGVAAHLAEAIGAELLVERVGALPEAILEKAREGAFDLIVVGRHPRPESFLGSIADCVVRYSPRSVLLVRTG
ncbi:MAG: universal stress protein [Ardenticatenaceae bacterium]|nr:universal stress protein [Ardenticatenaceae bacterium]